MKDFKLLELYILIVFSIMVIEIEYYLAKDVSCRSVQKNQILLKMIPSIRFFIIVIQYILISFLSIVPKHFFIILSLSSLLASLFIFFLE